MNLISICGKTEAGSIIITQQAVAYVGLTGDTATFTVVAEGEGLKYQWYYSDDAGATWTASCLSGYNTASFSFTVNVTRESRLYKCVITDAGGNIVETSNVSVAIG